METNLRQKPQNLRIERRKPEGGYCVISSHAILSAWLAYRHEIIELLDLRVWFACFELLARRCGAKNRREPRYSHGELQVLVGNNERGIRASLRRLERAGLVRWTESTVWVARKTSEIVHLDPTHRTLMADRPVPVPRRILRYLAGVQRPVLIATTVGHLLRGMYLRRGICVSGGRCKASWIADVFGVDVRNVKVSRRSLTQSRWLLAVTSSQTAMNRWGQAFVINLEWCLERTPVTPKSPPRGAGNEPQSPPPGDNKKLLIGSGTQEPAKRRASGAYARNGFVRAPCFRRVVLDDLQRPMRTAALFADAVRAGRVKNTLCDRMLVFAAAEHAKAYGVKNPCGLFVWLVQQRRWTHINQRDEDRARAALGTVGEDYAPPKTRRHAPDCGGNGSAPNTARHAGPEAARQVLAGTGSAAYSILAAVSAALDARHGCVAPPSEHSKRDSRHPPANRKHLAA